MGFNSGFKGLIICRVDNDSADLPARGNPDMCRILEFFSIFRNGFRSSDRGQYCGYLL